LAYFPRKVPARFETEKEPEKLVMSFPHLIIREVICFLVVVIVLSVMALLFNAPLEELADPQHTPNPAKAPWYFLGLQELLHSFPPVVAGVLIPLLVVIALVIIPYFNINVKREGLWIHNPRTTFRVFSSVVFILSLVCLLYDAFSIVVPSILLYCCAILPYYVKREKGWIYWLSRRSLAEWVMAWFVIVAIVLIVIGTFFRGPGWSWVWPWE
jgi:quinol-cytochrome oxidoreductase complex cytochrome b subunit